VQGLGPATGDDRDERDDSHAGRPQHRRVGTHDRDEEQQRRRARAHSPHERSTAQRERDGAEQKRDVAARNRQEMREPAVPQRLLGRSVDRRRVADREPAQERARRPQRRGHRGEAPPHAARQRVQTRKRSAVDRLDRAERRGRTGARAGPVERLSYERDQPAARGEPAPWGQIDVVDERRPGIRDGRTAGAFDGVERREEAEPARLFERAALDLARRHRPG
jgi:hypothetical protein